MNLHEIKTAFQTGKLGKVDYIDQMYGIHSYLLSYSDFIGDTDIDSIEIRSQQVIFTFKSTGVRLIADTTNKRIVPLEVLNFAFYESNVFDVITKLVRPGFIIVDAGANIGWYSLSLAKMFSDVQVWAFEPISETYQLLQLNIVLNELANVHSFNLGLSNQSGTAVFYVPQGGADNASAANLTGRPDVKRQTCPVTRLDEFVSEHALNRLDLIKCDVEGAELMVFLGAAETIRQKRPIIVSEMLRKWSAKFNYHPNDIITLLSGWGYESYAITKSGPHRIEQINEQTVETNFVFLHTEEHAYVLDSLIL